MADPDGDSAWLVAAINVFESNRGLADRAIAQLPDDKLHTALDANVNSVAVIVKHVAGNLRSRWTDFLTTDGEKPDRDRDREFVDDYPDRAAMLADWESGWATLFATLRGLSPADACRTVTIRGEPLSVPHAVLRSATHCAYHVGQIVQTARVLAGDDWQTLTIARGGSQAYNESVGEHNAR